MNQTTAWLDSGAKPWTQDALRGNGIVTLGEVAAMTAQELALLPGIGPRTMGDVQAVLAAHGLAFKPA
jgi:hypothetical protein